MIELKNLTKIYYSESKTVTALDDVNLVIPDGSVYGIIGLSGAGKSTLIRCINSLEKANSGQVLIDGKDVNALKGKELLSVRQNIGMIFQSFNLLEQRTVLGNVLFPLEIAKIDKKLALERAKALLETVELSDKLDAYPSQLSGGQKQRVAIARALATNPKYLLCDEATSALDPLTTASILKLLALVNKKFGVTVIIVTHELKVIESVCDYVAIIADHKIVETGKVTDVFTSPKTKQAKSLIFPAIETKNYGKSTYRLIFDGVESDMPIISALAIKCGIYVNIVYADTKIISGKTFGQMIISLDGDEKLTQTALDYLHSQNVKVSADGDVTTDQNNDEEVQKWTQ